MLVIVGADRSWQAWLVMLATVALTLGCWVTWGTRDGQWPRAAGMTWLVKIGGVAMLGVLADSPWWASLVYGSIWASIVLIPTGIASTVAREVA